MGTAIKFENFVEDLAKGVHQFQAAGHTLKVYLTNTAPNIVTHTVKGDLAGIAEINGYAAADIQNDLTRVDDAVTLSGVDVVWTATGAVGPFRYAVLYNDSQTSPLYPLICYWDYGTSISMVNGETFTVNLG